MRDSRRDSRRALRHLGFLYYATGAEQDQPPTRAEGELYPEP